MSRSEEMAAAILNGEIVINDPLCRKEQFLKAIANGEGTDNLPEPNCRKEQLLYQIAEKGLSGGGEDLTVELTEQETLLNELKMVVDGLKDKEGLPLTLTLPEEFSTVTDIFTFKVNEDILLVSGYSSNIGLWSYNINNGAWKQVYDDYGYWRIFQIVGNKCLIANYYGNSSNSRGGVLLYDMTTDTASRKYTVGGGWQYIRVVGNNCLIGSNTGSQGLLFYNSNDDTITLVEKNGYWFNFAQVGDDCLVSDSSYGTVLCTPENNSPTKVYDGAGHWSLAHQVNDNKWLITANGVSKGGEGLLLYNSDNKTVNLIYDKGTTYRHFQNIGDKCLIGTSNTASGYGVLMYDSVDDTITQIYTESSGWYIFQMVGEDCLICSKNSNSLGVLLYDFSSNLITKIYDTGYGWETFKIIDNKCLIAGSNNSTGVLVYDFIDKTIIPAYTSGYGYKYFQTVGDKCLIASGNSSSKGVLVYDKTDNTIEKKYTSGYGWEYFQIIGNICLITGKNNSEGKGVLIYNNEDKSIISAYSEGYYNQFTLNNGNCYIERDDKTLETRILYYNATDNSVKLVGYYLEVN